jgi:hypothetical protein
MTIANRDQLVAATVGSQKIPWMRSTQRTTVANAMFSMLDLSGQPGAGTLAGTSTAVGVVPTDATAGCPLINAFGGGNLGEISSIAFGCSVACRLRLYDLLFKAGAYPFNAAVSLGSQPSFSSRVPNGTDFTGLQLFIEGVTAFTGNPTITVTYTNDAGTPGRTTGAIAIGLAPTIGRMIQLPLQAGDNGVSKVESVTSTIATVGTFNVLVLRPLWTGRVNVANWGDTHGPDKTGLVQVFDTSALFMSTEADALLSGIPELMFTVGNG